MSTTDFLLNFNFKNKLLIWLDYDSMLYDIRHSATNDSILADIEEITARSKLNDFFILTINIDCPVDSEQKQKFLDDFDVTGDMEDMDYWNSLYKPVIILLDNIKDLKNLRTLILNEIGISEIPEHICELPQLQILDLSWCDNIHLPTNIDKLINLKQLKLVRCRSIESLPVSIGNLENLHSLDLSSCIKITSIPESIGNLTNLRELHLFGCLNLIKIPDNIDKLTKLEVLDISGYESKEGDIYSTLITSLPESIGDLQNLRVLRLDYCGGLSELPETISKLQNLEELCLRNTKITTIPESIKKLNKLKDLKLGNQIVYETRQ